MQKSVPHQVPQFVEFFVMVALVFAVFAWRYWSLHSLFDCLLYDGIAVVALVGQ